jgi:hypothetical protein
MRFAVIAVVVAGCYSPEFTPCTVRCAAGAPGLEGSCPGGQQCLADNFCHASADETSCPCLPLRCEELDGRCGLIPDGCDGMIDCGCTSPDSCGGGGIADQCGSGSCTPAPCPINTCGPFETCGMTIDCATCAAPTTCGGTGTLNECGTCSTSPFMPGFPAMNCGFENPYYCSNINACVADEVNCLTHTECPGESGDFFCPCGFVVSCETMDCVPGASSE